MKKITVATSSRADYGLLKPLLVQLERSNDFILDLCVTGSHLSSEFGDTQQEIIEDGLQISKRIYSLASEGIKSSVVDQMALISREFFNHLSKVMPDLVVVLGDRYEIFSIAQAAFFHKVPILHLHGGEITEGAFDDVIRHSITKMSSYHFTCHDIYRKRVIQMGEHPKRVFNFGALGLDTIRSTKLLSRVDLEKFLDFKLNETTFLITYHPCTYLDEKNGVRELIKALKKFPDASQVITMPNCDPGNENIRELLISYAKEFENVKFVESLGRIRYLSMANISSCVIGNSSSGLIEIPFLGVPTVNIGSRQNGRIKLRTVVDSLVHEDAICKSISKAISNNVESDLSFGDGNTTEKIMEFLREGVFETKTGFHDCVSVI